MFILTVQGFIHTVASYSMRNRIICLIGESGNCIPHIASSFAILSLTISSISAVCWVLLLALVEADSIRVVTGSIIACGSIGNCLAPTSVWEANFNAKRATIITAFTDSIFFLTIAGLYLSQNLTTISFAVALATKWILHASALWIPLVLAYRWVEFTPKWHLLKALFQSIPFQSVSNIAINLPMITTIIASSWACSWRDTGLLSILVLIQQFYLVLSFQLHRTVQPYIATHELFRGRHRWFLIAILSYTSLLALVIGLMSFACVPFFFRTSYAEILVLLPVGLATATIMSCNQMYSFQLTLALKERFLLFTAIISAIVLSVGYAVDGYFASIFLVQTAGFLAALVTTLLFVVHVTQASPDFQSN